MSELPTLKDKMQELTDEEQHLIISVIRHRSTGGHPYPDDDSLPYFTQKFVSNLLKKEMKKLTPQAVDLAKNVLKKLN